MKRLLLLFALFAYYVTLPGCVKDDPQPKYKIDGKWVLVDAELFIKKWDENGVVNPWYRYQTVSDTQPEFCLNLYGSNIPLDNIYKDSTTFDFDSKARRLTLNGNQKYEFKPFTTYYTVLNVYINGTSRPYTIDDINENYMRLTESGREQALFFDGVYDNHKYYSKLIFKREGVTGVPNLRPGMEDAIDLGLIPPTLPISNEVASEKWLIYEYRRANSSISYSSIADTISFINNYEYKSSMSGIQIERYTLANYGAYFRLSLEHTGLSAGLESQEIPPSHISSGEIKRIGFKELIPNGGIVYLSMRKIQ
jgi:hypothetical protein